jgi:hypothetical protein
MDTPRVTTACRLPHFTIWPSVRSDGSPWSGADARGLQLSSDEALVVVILIIAFLLWALWPASP